MSTSSRVSKRRRSSDRREGLDKRSKTAASTVERTTRNAPMSLIKGINTNFSSRKPPSESRDLSEDVIINGIVSDQIALMSLKGFYKLSSRWLFMSTDSIELRTKSPLLFGTCILAGLHINPALHGSDTHKSLYRHVHGLLGQANITSPASLETIQSMLIFSMWDLMLDREHDHGNCWLLSGTAAMQVMMTTNFEQLLQVKDRQGNAKARECAKILKFPSYNSRDELVLSGVELYRVLWKLISSDEVQKESTIWLDIEKLRKAQDHFYNLDSSEPLRFAYSCTYLILSRHSLQHICELRSGGGNHAHAGTQIDLQAGLSEKPDPTPFLKLAIHHSHQLLHLFLSMSDLTNVHPAYENLLCSFAMVTLAEFVVHLPDVCDTMTLMERAISHIQRGGKAEPVSKWTLNVVKQHIVEMSELERTVFEDSFGVVRRHGMVLPVLPASGSITPRHNILEDDYRDTEQEFPSLEEMFLGNMI
ncbi:hypothetical protein B7463_g10673, partial [Scytalidium lignicola]